MIDLKQKGRGAQKVWPLGVLSVAPPGAAM